MQYFQLWDWMEDHEEVEIDQDVYSDISYKYTSLRFKKSDKSITASDKFKREWTIEFYENGYISVIIEYKKELFRYMCKDSEGLIQCIDHIIDNLYFE